MAKCLFCGGTAVFTGLGCKRAGYFSFSDYLKLCGQCQAHYANDLCSRIHIEKAKNMGVSNEELEEAAALAVAFAGCRALMLWNELKKELL